MKYAVELISAKIRTDFKYKIIDLKGESRNIVNLLTTFTDLKFVAIISAAEVSQTNFAAQLYSGATYNIPIYNTLASTSFFENSIGAKALNVFQYLPNEEMEAMAIVGILMELNWLYVSVVSSADSFIQRSVGYFLSKAKINSICIANHVRLPSGTDAEELQEQLVDLNRYHRSKIIVLFTLPYLTSKVLNTLGNQTDLHIVSGTNWRATMSTVKGSLRAATGSILLQYRNTRDKEFNSYFTNLTLHSYNDNKWFEQFWEETFSCQAKARPGTNQTMPNCTGSESLQGRVDLNHSVITPTIFAIESIACTVECIRKKRCYWCKPHGDLFYKCIIAYFREFQDQCNCNVHKRLFASKSATEKPDSDSFEILTFNGKDYAAVGMWQFNRTTIVGYLDLNVSQITWKQGKKPESFSYTPCLVGEIEQHEATADMCCYECVKCKANEITRNGTCVACAQHTAPNPTRDECKSLPKRYIYDETRASTALRVGSILGIAINIVISVVLSKYWNTKVVKATGRELIVAILTALFLSFSSPLVFLIRPSVIVCGIQRFILGFCLTGCYIPLLLKTNRIYRIFTASRKLSLKQWFVSTKSQVLSCIGFFLVQLLLGMVWIVGNIPEIALYDVNQNSETAVVCKQESINMIFNLIPCLVLMAACTFYGFKTRNFPSNFNEAYSISITMYVSCLLWGIFIPLMFFLEKQSTLVFNHIFLIAGFMIVIGYVTQIGLFASKIFRVCRGQKINSSHKQSQFFFSRDEQGRESTSTKCSQLTTVRHPCSFEQRQIELETCAPSPGQLIQYDGERYNGLRSRTRRASRVSSESF